jgi:hypothetical protein
MEPTLADGQGLIGVRWRHARVGQIRCIEHPARPGFWLVKRIDDVFDDGTISVLSDNRESTRADSRTFGPVRADDSYLVVLRIPRHLM